MAYPQLTMIDVQSLDRAKITIYVGHFVPGETPNNDHRGQKMSQYIPNIVNFQLSSQPLAITTA